MKRILFLLCFFFALFMQADSTDDYWELSERYNLDNKRDSAIIVLENAIQYYQQQNANVDLAAMYNHLGIRQQTYGNWDESAFAYVKSIEILKVNSGNDSLKSHVYLNLGLLYVKMSSELADYYLNVAEELALLSANDYVLFVLYKVTGRLEEGVKFAKRIKNNQFLANYYYLLANSSLDLNVKKLYFDSARIVLPRLPSAKLQNFQYHFFIVDYFLKNNQTDSALYHCKKAEEIAPLLNDDEVNYDYMVAFSKTYLGKGDYEKAYKYKEKAALIERHYNNPTIVSVLNEIDKQRVFFEKENVILKLKAQRKIRSIFIFVFLGFFILIYVVVRRVSRLNEKLEVTNATKDRLFSIISHDLRGSISSIILLAQSEDAESLKIIKKGASSLLLEFDNLLNWSAEHMDKIVLHPKILDLNEIIEETIGLLKTQISDKKLVIKKEYAEDCICFSDENTTKIVIRNILHNAIKYSPINTEIKVVITENDTITKLEIRDNGCGFACNHQSKGLGLGLDLCKEFLKLNNGELVINSTEKGSVVVIILPLDAK
jgi:signal transduction histidine kinase